MDIYSYADSIGTDAYNKALSLRRAQSVRTYLAGTGIAESRMNAKAFGERMPARPNSIRGIDYPTGRQLNRRTEFVIVQEDPTRRIIFKSNQPGTIDAQQKNLMVPEQQDDNTADPESNYGEPGSRVNKDQNP